VWNTKILIEIYQCLPANFNALPIFCGIKGSIKQLLLRKNVFPLLLILKTLFTMFNSPYNLETKTGNPVQFYDDLNAFTDLVLQKGRQPMQNYLNDFSSFTKKRKLRSYQPEEHLMEILMSGIFWKNYQSFLSIDALFYEPLFNSLYQWRKKYPRFKARIDAFRGKLAYRYLSQKRNSQIPLYRRFEYLNSWLNCSKEFVQEAERLNQWKLFLEAQPLTYQENFWQAAEAFANWFILQGAIHLSEYTKGWDDFMMDHYAEYQQREDFIFSTRKPSEYHLNMVAAEIMNRSLRKGFENTRQKILLVPTCMAQLNGCLARMEDGNIVCQNCSPECHVAKLNQSMNKLGVRTVLIPHSTGFSKYLKPWRNSSDTGLIGVACVLNLLTGGYEMQKLNIPSQCVFLDSCGCKKHWLSGQPTRLNLQQLNKLLLHEESKKPVNCTC
jgi:hypothetical protein